MNDKIITKNRLKRQTLIGRCTLGLE